MKEEFEEFEGKKCFLKTKDGKFYTIENVEVISIGLKGCDKYGDLVLITFEDIASMSIIQN